MNDHRQDGSPTEWLGNALQEEEQDQRREQHRCRWSYQGTSNRYCEHEQLALLSNEITLVWVDRWGKGHIPLMKLFCRHPRPRAVWKRCFMWSSE